MHVGIGADYTIPINMHFRKPEEPYYVPVIIFSEQNPIYIHTYVSMQMVDIKKHALMIDKPNIMSPNIYKEIKGILVLIGLGLYVVCTSDMFWNQIL